MTIQMIEARHCTLSRLNVRKVPSEPALLAQLMADIEARGVLQNLIGVPAPKKSGKYEVIAGGRRLNCVKQLIADGKLPANATVPMLVLDQRDRAAEVSLAENLQREAMNPADACLAFRHCIEVDGATVEDVARRFGVAARFVEGRLRLGQLAPAVFDALRNGEISLDVAKAYGVTGDHARQAQVFEAARRFNYAPHSIRRMMVDDTMNATDRLALLVGRDAYLATGGRIEADLFGDAGEIWLDASIVIALADAKMATAAAQIEGYAAVVPVAAARPGYEQTREMLALSRTRLPLTDEETARADVIEAELQALQTAYDQAEDAANEEAIQARFDALETELASLRDKWAEPAAQDRATATAFLVIDKDGKIVVHDTLYVSGNLDKQRIPGTTHSATCATDEGDDDQGAVLSRGLTDELAVQRRDLLAVHIAHNPGMALDLMIFILADARTRTAFGDNTGVNIAARPNGRGAAEFRTRGPIAEELGRIGESLDQSWCTHSDLTSRYAGFCALGEEERAAWAGWVVAHSLEATLRDERHGQFQNHLGQQLGIDVAAWWRPTADNLFGRIRKRAILAILEQIGGPELRGRYAAAKKTELAVAAEKICAGSAIIEPQIKVAAIAWVPDMMQFAGSAGHAASDATEEAGTGHVEADHKGEETENPDESPLAQPAANSDATAVHADEVIEPAD